MLVGGLDILGIYCIDYQQAQAKQVCIRFFVQKLARQSLIYNYFSRLSNLLTQIYKALNGFDYYKQMNFNSDRLLFMIDTAKKRYFFFTPSKPPFSITLSMNLCFSKAST